MGEFTLKAQVRSVLGKKTKTLRSAGMLPAVLYGHGVTSLSLTVPLKDFQRLYRQTGESTLIDLAVDRQSSVKVIVQAVQTHPSTGRILHVDFHQVRMSEKLHTEIPLSFIGEPPAVKELGGVLVKHLSQLKVAALPGDLVPEIEVDINQLKSFDDIIRVRHLRLPTGITVLENVDDVVCLVTPPRSEAELKELEQKVEEDVTSVEGVKKEEVEEGEEAEEPAGSEEPKKERKEHAEET